MSESPRQRCIVVSSAAPAQHAALIRHLDRAGCAVQPWWLRDPEPERPPVPDDARLLLVLDAVDQVPAESRIALHRVVKAMWSERRTLAFFNGSANLLAAAGVLPPDAPAEGEGLFTHEGAATTGAIDEALDALAEQPHALR
jgi:hypothetical protein